MSNSTMITVSLTMPKHAWEKMFTYTSPPDFCKCSSCKAARKRNSYIKAMYERALEKKVANASS